jgi:hypothetical protein
VRCLCRRYYRVFTGAEDYQARFACGEADQMGARFLDARVEPFVVCACGQVMDFASETSLMVM